MSTINSDTEELSIPEHKFSMSKLTMGIMGFPLVTLLGTVLATILLELNIVGIVIAVLAFIASELLILALALSVVGGSFRGKVNNWKDILYIKNFRFKQVANGFFVGIALFFILQATAVLIKSSGEQIESSDTSASLQQVDGVGRYIVLLFLVPFIVPLVEELFFRGFIFGFIVKSGMKSKKLALAFGIIFSSVMFGLAHQQGFDTTTGWFVIALTATIGAVNCWLVYKSDSIWPAYACHMSYNLCTTSLSLLAMSLQS